jgi:small subunit ribosomal protein S21
VTNNFSVEVYDQESFERALRRFSIKTKKSGILREIKKKRFYTKPSVQKKLDLMRSIRRQKKAERLAQMTAADKAKAATKRNAKRPGQR